MHNYDGKGAETATVLLLFGEQMLLRFAVKNFRSIQDWTELNFVASPKMIGTFEPFHDSTYDVAVLHRAAIYGANASGKSNVLKAIFFTGRAVEESHNHWKPHSGVPVEPFMLDPKSENEPSEFEADLIIDEERFVYGFSATREKVITEYLYSFNKKRRSLVFRRDVRSNRIFSFARAYASSLRTLIPWVRDNSLFLSVAAQNNHRRLGPIADWFSNKILSVSDGDRNDRIRYTAQQMSAHPEFKKTIVRLLQSADLGICGFSFEPDMAYAGIKKELTAAFQAAAEKVPGGAKVTGIHVESDPRSMLAFDHIGSDKRVVKFDLDQESLGTISFFSMLGPMTLALSKGALLLIDELDSSLHPILARLIVSMFGNVSSSSKATKKIKHSQLAFTTHDTALLTSEVLRRDEIWFTEKDKSGATKLYPLSDFTPRKSENLQKGYIQGRYGAIPFVGDFVWN